MFDKVTRPEDILGEHESYAEVNGVKIRKATMGATLRNANVLSSPTASAAEKNAAKKIIEELSPGLVVMGLLEHMSWKNPEIQTIFEETKKQLAKVK